MKKVNAFTIIELLLVLVLTGLVSAIGYTCYDIVSRQFSSFRSANRNSVEVSWLNAILQRDFLNASEISKKANGIILTFRGSPEVNYEFNTDNIARITAGVQDTFSFSVKSIKMLFLKNDQRESGALVDEIEAIVTDGETAYSLHMKKQYGADKLLDIQNGN